MPSVFENKLAELSQCLPTKLGNFLTKLAKPESIPHQAGTGKRGGMSDVEQFEEGKDHAYVWDLIEKGRLDMSAVSKNKIKY